MEIFIYTTMLYFKGNFLTEYDISLLFVFYRVYVVSADVRRLLFMDHNFAIFAVWITA